MLRVQGQLEDIEDAAISAANSAGLTLLNKAQKERFDENKELISVMKSKAPV